LFNNIILEKMIGGDLKVGLLTKKDGRKINIIESRA
jgi:hypothetical protein